MSCNCNSGETPEYHITLDGVGADGYSPQINIVQEDTSSFKLNLINKNNEQITPAIPKLEYLNDTFVTNDALNTTLEDYSTTVEMNTALDLKLNKDGSNATNPITLNNFKVQSVGTGTRVGSEGQLTLYGSTARPAYIPQGDTPKTLALFSDIPTIGNGIITIRQGGVTKGSFNVNQSTNNTIDLDAGGGGVSGNQITLITEDGTRGVSLGINNTTKEAFMTYDIIGGISFDLNLISGKTAPITLTKNSDGTYGIGLDYDNDTLKVNQNGQLYADIEAPSYTAGTGIDITNNEISVDSDYIEAHKAYLADGDILTDPQGLEDVKYYNNSSFDSSKFTIVGSPTITDGVVSGFSSSNFIVTPSIDWANANSWELIIPYKFTATGTREAIIGDVTEGTGIRLAKTINELLAVYFGNGSWIYWHGGIAGLTLSVNTQYFIKIAFTGAAYTLALSTNLGKTYTQYLNQASTTKMGSAAQCIGIQRGTTYPATNSIIDLKYFSVTINGQEVFSGNKTGVDTYTIGSDTITIPYKVSKAGSKIVDSSRRPEVEAVYEDQGYALYYTLDETNGNFTLPMGEIYGYITRLEGIVKDLQTRLTALESNINGGGAEVVQQGLLGMSPLSLNRPQLLDELIQIDGLDTIDIEPTEEITQEELEPQPVENEIAQEEIEEKPQTIEEEVVQEEVDEGGENE